MGDGSGRILRTPFGISRERRHSRIEEVPDEGWVVVFQGKRLSRRWSSIREARQHLDNLHRAWDNAP